MCKKLEFIIPFLGTFSIAVATMASDMYLPSLPAIVQDFQTTANIVQLTLAANLLGMCLSGFIYGPLSDMYGRRTILMAGFVGFTCFSLACAISTHIYALILLRFFQGCGGGVSSVVTWVMVKDVFSSRKSTQITSRMLGALVLTPVLAPVLGGFIIQHFSWRVIFFILAGFGMLLISMCLFWLPETQPADASAKTDRLSLKRIRRQYWSHLVNLRFCRYAFILGAPIGGKWCFVTVAPFVFIDTLGIAPEHFGLMIASTLSTYIVLSFFVQRYVMHYGSEAMLRFGLNIGVVFGIIFIIIANFFTLSPFMLIMGASLYIGVIAVIAPTSSSLALECFPRMRGISSSLIATVRIGLGFLGSTVGGLLPDENFIPASFFMASLLIIARLSLLLPAEKKESTTLSSSIQANN